MKRYSYFVLKARETQRALIARYEDIDPCPQCGAIDLDYRRTCIHRNDDRFGSPRCDDGL
jgi:hypothetical protein